MEVVIRDDAAAVASYVADLIERVVVAHPSAVLGVATGSSPLPTYAELIRRQERGDIDLRGLTLFLLDEYIGLPPGHTQSYRRFIDEHLAVPAGIDPDAVHVPGAGATGADLADACRAFEDHIRTAGGVDLQLLGIGTDGHLGFNEPTSSLGSRTRIKTLTEQTRRDNARFFDSLEQVPRHVVTQGIGTILDARHLVLVATGAGKAAAVARMVEGPLAAVFPASALQLHRQATIVIDEDAATELTLGDYYRHTFDNKPDWQRVR